MDKINHPIHYKREGRKECIEEIKELFGAEAQYYFCVGNCWKYIYRAGLKNDKNEDIQKAMWYFSYIIDHHLSENIEYKKFNSDFLQLAGAFKELNK